MKKIAYFLSVLFLMTAFVPVAVGAPKNETELTVAERERLSEIESRIAEIKAMDISELSKEERKSVKKELKEMKKEAKQVGGGVYISAGAIIIILLLILIL